MARVDTSAYTSFDDIVGRLDEIVGVVRDKDTSLERSLDLFEEAIGLGSKAVDMVDKVDFTAHELARMEEAQAQSEAHEAAQEQPVQPEDATPTEDTVSKNGIESVSSESE